MNALRHGLLGTALVALAGSGPARAQDAMPAQPVVTAQLARQVCAACHGVDGNSPRAGVPSLAGQFSGYLESQLHAFAAQGGQRADGVMGAIAVNLSADEMQRLARWFSHQALRPAVSAEDARPERVEHGADGAPGALGERIFFAGLPGKGVDSCAACHGVRGEGLPDRYPRLAGQHPAYLAAQLRDFRAGRRSSDAQAVMRRVAAGLSDRELDAVARYVSLLR